MKRLAALVAVCALSAACGSTVQVHGSETVGGSGVTTGGDGLGGTGGTSGSAGSASSGGSGTVLPGGGGAGTGGSSGTSGATSGGFTSGDGSSGQDGGGKRRYPKGVTDTTITIGTSYSSSDVTAQLGVKGSTQGDIPSQYRALVAAINKRGGIAGRKLVLVIHDPGSNAQNADTAAAAECTYFTQDRPAFAVLSSGANESSRSCLYKGGVSLVLNQNVTRSNRDVFGKYPNYLEPITVNRDRVALPFVRALEQGGYFGGWDPQLGQASTVAKPVVGLMTFSGEQEVAAKRSLLPAFAAAGHPVSEKNTYYVLPPSGTADGAARSAADISNAVLKFRSNGVTHVVFDDYGGTFSVFFTKYAESQNYYPRYGMTSQSAPQVFLTAGEISTKSMQGAVGLGQWPILDLRDEDNPVKGPYSNAARRTCEAFLTSLGVTWADANSHLIAMSTCDLIGLVQTVLTKVGRTISTEAVIRALGTLGSVKLAANLDTRLTQTQHDGAAAGYAFAYTPSCTCMRYVGPRVDLG